jgi:hypothetical protein
MLQAFQVLTYVLLCAAGMKEVARLATKLDGAGMLALPQIVLAVGEPR